MKKILCSLLIVLSFPVLGQNLDVVGGYFPSWRSTSNASFLQYNYLYYAFANATVSGGMSVSNTGNFQNFKNATTSPGAKKLISIGSTNMPAMATTAQARIDFADTLRKFCRYHNLNGIDMDWEAINNATDRTNFTSLMKEIRKTIDTTDLELVATVGFGNYWLQWYENEGIEQADFVQLMVYDQTGTWSSSPFGNHASMDHVLQAETYWVDRGFARNKLVIGLPFYGYKFSSTSGGSAEAVTYADILIQFPSLTSSDNYLSKPGAYYFFNGVDLIQQKTNYAIDNGFKGVFVWEIAQDNINHVLSLDKALKDAAYRVASVEDENMNDDLSNVLYPNPAVDALHLNEAYKNKVAEIVLLNSLGKELTRVNQIEQLSLSKYPSGIYIVVLKLHSGELISQKLSH